MPSAGLRRRDLLRWAGSAGALSVSVSCGGGGGSDTSTDTSTGTTGDASSGTTGDTTGTTGTTPSEEAIAHSWDGLTPENAPATFRHVDQLGPTRNFARGGPVAPLPAHSRSLLTLRYTHEGRSATIQDYLARTRNAGLLVLKGGAVAFESYGLGNSADTRWTSFSVAKSLTSTLFGAALQSRALTSLDVRIDAVLPSFAGTAYEGATVRQLLRMTSGVRWVEDYLSSTSDSSAMQALLVSQRPGALLEYVRTRPRAAEPGTVWNYNSGDTNVLGALLAAVTGLTMSEFLEQRIWSRAGMEADAYWLLDAPGGQELASGNFSARLRDYGRLGLFVLREGQIGAQRLLPAGWRDLAGRPDTALTAPGRLKPGYPLGYGYQWWALPNSSAFIAQGIFGQFLYIDPAEDIVAVIWSAWTTPWDSAAEYETYAMLAAATQALG